MTSTQALDAKQTSNPVKGYFTQLESTQFYCIEDYDQLPPFFMSLVSGYDHWCFIASNGGITAGRQNAEKALFPYYTEDKLMDLAGSTGSYTRIRVNGQIWTPFASGLLKNINAKRRLYKSVAADELVFEESLNGLVLQVSLGFSDKFGLVRRTKLSNRSSEAVSVELLDGWQNLLPANTDVNTQMATSNLLNAYKFSELVDDRLAVYSFSSLLSDLAEPSESLRANVVWSTGLDAEIDLNPDAPAYFEAGTVAPVQSATRGVRGAYFIKSSFKLDAGNEQQWAICADVYFDQVETVALQDQIGGDMLAQIRVDQERSRQALLRRVAVSDGLQMTGDQLSSAHHYANCLFNIMRGGMFDNGYQIEKSDLVDYIKGRNVEAARSPVLANLDDTLDVEQLQDFAHQQNDATLKRLCLEYLPVSFSRRHGDPSRPWNKFSINLKDENGNEKLDYQGNWRDIFQNWEPLGLSYPKFFPSMISAFFNATTLDGYNPYRVTRQGIEWEEPEENDPWSNIGYWSDHQIIYLSKLLEGMEQTQPDAFQQLLQSGQFTYADVPYRIKRFEQLMQDPHNSIEFDHEHNATLKARAAKVGGDGKLVATAAGDVLHVSMIEKLVSLWTAKLTNFVPGGGVWMNTQRPEWNDANNALVGWGLSMVTTNYLYRHLKHMKQVLQAYPCEAQLSQAQADCMEAILSAFAGKVEVNDASARYQTVRALSAAGESLRAKLYQVPYAVGSTTVSTEKLLSFIDQVLPWLEATIRANLRDDGLYHSYNLIHFAADTVEVHYLDPMLEGQVAVLSSGLLSPQEAADVLAALRQSPLYRTDQHTYVLYPNKQLPGFLQKNTVDPEALKGIGLCERLLADPQNPILRQDKKGQVRFSADFKKAAFLSASLNNIAESGAYGDVTAADREALLAVYEQTFDHRSFTGRSGCFFAYEGLGSTYWHMVSKLLLAAMEAWQQAREQNLDSSLQKALYHAYYDIRQGIGFNKTPEEYGAFPTDPYSHTPETGQARQPGMTGQVKEELLTRQVELGLHWSKGELKIDTGLLRQAEFLQEQVEWTYLDLAGNWQTLTLNKGEAAFTVCQVPVILKQADAQSVVVESAKGSTSYVGLTLNKEVCQGLIQRDGSIKQITINIK